MQKLNNMLCEVHGDEALSQKRAYEWFKLFKNGRTSANDNELSGKRSKPLIAQVKNVCGNH